MSTLPFDLPAKVIQPSPSNQFLFLTGTEDFTIPKHAAAKAAGEKTFIHICKVHGAGKHYASNSFCVECNNDNSNRWAGDNRERRLEHNKRHRQTNRDKCLERLKRYRDKNSYLCLAMTTCNRMGLPYKGLRKRLLYTEKEFKLHIESLWTYGMCWANYGIGKGCWNIDHKIPVSHFLKMGEKDISVINALSNLQPLWQEDNVKKG
ncbi:hypothetical protein R8O76_002751 [Klebsiella michiganensis]|nr:hypothetical protein [Klebsiella michiganensis]